MSEAADNVPETGPVSVDDVLQAIQRKNIGQAKANFQDVMSDKVTQALDAEKVKIAGNIFNGVAEEEPEEEESEVDVESELEDAFEEEEVDAESN
jgi:hypothetical protein